MIVVRNIFLIITIIFSINSFALELTTRVSDIEVYGPPHDPGTNRPIPTNPGTGTVTGTGTTDPSTPDEVGECPGSTGKACKWKNTFIYQAL